jgi:hypothetical protein
MSVDSDRFPGEPIAPHRYIFVFYQCNIIHLIQTDVAVDSLFYYYLFNL